MHSSCIKSSAPRLGCCTLGIQCGCRHNEDSEVHAFQALFLKDLAVFAQGLSLLSPGATHLVTNFLMVASILDLKEALKQKVADVE
jgi:hypothetical protein